jgi:hypothetical protein
MDCLPPPVQKIVHGYCQYEISTFEAWINVRIVLVRLFGNILYAKLIGFKHEMYITFDEPGHAIVTGYYWDNWPHDTWKESIHSNHNWTPILNIRRSPYEFWRTRYNDYGNQLCGLSHTLGDMTRVDRCLSILGCAVTNPDPKHIYPIHPIDHWPVVTDVPDYEATDPLLFMARLFS